MRRVHALAAACATALPAALLAGCSDRPNDLYTYYEDPTATETVAAAAPSPSPTPTTTSAPAGPDAADLVAATGLTSADLVEEEVAVDTDAVPTTTVTLPDCNINLGARADAGAKASWKYPSGSVLRQYTVHTPTEADVTEALDAARAALDCSSFKIDSTKYLIDEGPKLATVPGADSQLTWCASGTTKAMCTVILAKGPLLTAISVQAGTMRNARDAIIRIAPVAAEALSREPA